MREVWRNVPSQPELLVSSLGRVMVKPHTVAMPCGRGYAERGGVPTRGQWDGARFIYARRGHRSVKLARLICEAFHGPAPPGRPYCLHRDENARNNRPDNLYWGTQRENLNMPGFLAYCRSRTGENSPTIKGRQAKLRKAMQRLF